MNLVSLSVLSTRVAGMRQSRHKRKKPARRFAMSVVRMCFVLVLLLSGLHSTFRMNIRPGSIFFVRIDKKPFCTCRSRHVLSC